MADQTSKSVKDATSNEKLALLIIAGMCVGALTWLALAALRAGDVDPNVSTLIGVIATGLIAFGKDIVAAIRGYSMSAQLGKVTDQLAASQPSEPMPLSDEPQHVVIDNDAIKPVPVVPTAGSRPLPPVPQNEE